MSFELYSPVSAPGRLIASSNVLNDRFKSYLLQSDETMAAEKDMSLCLMVKIVQRGLSYFDRELIMKEITKITGVERKFLIVKRIGADEHMIWLEKKESCDLIMSRHQTIFANGARCEFSRWHPDWRSEMNQVHYHVWLEFFYVPAHYYLLDTAWNLVSNMGEIVSMDNKTWDTDVSCMSICIDAEAAPPMYGKIPLIYDTTYMVECVYRVVFILPLDDYWSLDFEFANQNYSDILNEVQTKYANTKSGRAFEKFCRLHFRDFVEWQMRNEKSPEVSDEVRSSYNTPLRPVKTRRLESSSNSNWPNKDADVCWGLQGNCYLTTSEDSLMNLTDHMRCVVVWVESPIGSSFRLEDVIDHFVCIYGGNADSYKWKHYVDDQFLIWMNMKSERDELCGRCEWLSVNGIKVWLKPWSSNLNATMVNMKSRVWLEIVDMPLHYYQNRQLVTLTSHLGFVVAIDSNRLNYDHSVIALCLETLSEDVFPFSIGVVYDRIYLKKVIVKKIFDVPCSIYKIVDGGLNARNYNAKVNECRKFITSKKFHELMDNKYGGEFSLYLKYNRQMDKNDPS